MDCNDLVNVYTVVEPVEAEIIKNFLRAEGIRCFVDGEHQAGIQGIAAFEIGILVPAADADRARKLIQKHPKPGAVAQKSPQR
jgi:hypothetical protein